MEFTEQQISAVARVLSDRAAEDCGVDKDDNWKTYSENYLNDAHVALGAIAAAPQVVADERRRFLDYAHEGDRLGTAQYGQEDGEFADHATQAAWEAWQARAAALVQAQEPRKPTDISKRLRAYADERAIAAHYADLMRVAADEIERYYGGMLNWKATAEAKDAAPVQPVAVPDDRVCHKCSGNGETHAYFCKAAAPAAQGDAKDAEDWPTPAMEDAFFSALPVLTRDEVDHPNDTGRVNICALLRDDNFAVAFRAAIAAKAAS